MNMMLLILITANFVCSKNMELFDEYVYKRLKIPDGFITNKSDFGFSMIYSKAYNELFVSAPGAPVNSTNPTMVGSVFGCPFSDNSNYQCKKKFSIPNEFMFTEYQKTYNPMFGYSMEFDIDQSVVICGPNIPYVNNLNYYCYSYNQKDGKLNSLDGIMKVPFSWPSKIILNFGIMLKNITINGQSYFLIGKLFHRSSEYPEPAFQAKTSLMLLKTADNTIQYFDVKFSVTQIYLNPIPDKIMKIVAAYAVDLDLLGSFSVINENNDVIQYVKNKAGTAYQLFGYSGAYEDFDNDNCADILLSAPFYSFHISEGAAFYYRCDNINKRFNTSPIRIFGDFEPNALFGTAVATIGDVDSNKYNDVAILAPYPKESFTRIYIHLGSKSGISSIYAQVLEIKNNFKSINYYAFSMLGKFDYNNDGVFDLAVSFPAKNEVALIKGIKFSEVVFDLVSDTNITANKITYGVYMLDSINTPGHYFDHNITLCFSVLSVPPEYYNYNLKFLVDLSTNATSYVNFFVRNTYRSFYMELSNVLKNTSRYCYNVPMKFLITYETFKSPFNLMVRCSLRMDYSEKCMGECLKPNEIDSIETFTLKFPKCPKGSECEPKYSINTINEIPRAIPSEATTILPIQLEFKNNGRTPIYFPKISIFCDQFTSIVDSSFSFKLANIDKFDEPTLDTKLTIKTFVIYNPILPDSSLILFAKFSFTPTSKKAKDIKIGVKLSDSLSRENYSYEYELSLGVENIYTLDYYYSSNPKEIFLDSGLDFKFTNSISALYLTLEIRNNGPSPSYNIIVESEVETNAQKMLNYNKSLVSNNVKMVDCDLLSNMSGNYSKCGMHNFLIDQIPKDSKATISLLYLMNRKLAILSFDTLTSLFTKFNISEIIDNNKILKESSNIETKISLRRITIKGPVIWIFFIAVVLPLLLITSICILLYKYKIFEKLKFQKPDDLSGA